MSIIFQQLSDCSDYFLQRLKEKGTEVDEGHNFDWPNYVFTSNKFRRAHLDIVDAIETKKLYMMHLCIFPHIDDSSPVFGFDIIAGPNKVTGAFHDFSPLVYKNTLMFRHFKKKVKDLEWSKKRELPQWAKNIFSNHMVAAGNIQSEGELKVLLDLAKDNLRYYLENVGSNPTPINTITAQNHYCYNQRQNPHTPKVMASLGLNPDQVNLFIETCLFPLVH